MKLHFGILGVALVAAGCVVRPFVVRQADPEQVVASGEAVASTVLHPPVAPPEGAAEAGQVIASADVADSVADTVPPPAAQPEDAAEEQVIASTVPHPPTAQPEDAAEIERSLQLDFLEHMRQLEAELPERFVWGSASEEQVAVLFDFDSAEITPQGQIALRAQAAWLLAHPQAEVVLEGHADAIGEERYNEELGERRAVSVRDYLIGEGVDAGRFTIESRGENDPLVRENVSAPENRRVVTRVLEH